ncbi:hypothetical protein DRW03_34870 [Corallococcus sp. H22C18031201]|nr:hypothetical protein DRW03_34870 [Corallococcus sp. H22C18031201]
MLRGMRILLATAFVLFAATAVAQSPDATKKPAASPHERPLAARKRLGKPQKEAEATGNVGPSCTAQGTKGERCEAQCQMGDTAFCRDGREPDKSSVQGEGEDEADVASPMCSCIMGGAQDE